MTYIVYDDIESLIRKQIDAQTIQKNIKHQKQANMFLADVQYQLNGLLIVQKINIIYIVAKIV